MTEILLNKTKNIHSVNVENSTFIELSTKRNPIITEDFNGVLDNYELYLEERNSCKNYKLSFTIQPYMSNVLFNAFTEIIKDDRIIGDDANANENDKWFEEQDIVFNRRTQTGDTNIPYRYQLIRDTECSHEKLGNLTYRCGADIFNNHYLRTNDFCFIQSALTSDDKSWEVFNTIEDYVRYSDGTIAKHLREVPKENVTASVSRPSHIFNRENLEGFFDAYSNRIKDENGWLGFYNRAYANIPNYKVKDENITINKCINNRNACDFIDMFPDRTLFSFLPRLNYKKNVKEEFNWDWCLTYPCENVYFDVDKNKEFDFFNKYGIKIIWHSRGDARLDKSQINRESKFVYFRTKCKHNLSANDVVRFTYLTGGIKNDFSARVLGVGNEEGEHKMYYFYVSYEDLAMEFNEENESENEENESESEKYGGYYITLPDNMYISRVVNGQACQYYIRKFKKLNKEYSSTLNKLAFSKTIYNDDIVQILYGDNVNVSDLKDNLGREIKDNLGREISEIFLTIIKRNKGHELFYGNGSFGNDVEGSSCFGKVTAGFNFETYEGEDTIVDVNSVDSSGENMVFKDYNIRTTYNLENFGDDVEIDSIITNMELPTKSKNILNPNGITIDDDGFYGDFVEFSPSTLFETVIEDVYHRFNTSQREYILNGNGFPCNFTQLMYDEIDYGDFDFVFTGDSVTAITTSNIPSEDEFIKINYGLRDIEEGDDVASYVYYDNIFPEGYFYKPHYRVKLREYSDIYTEDYDVKIEYESIDSGGTVGNVECYSVSTQENYALTTLDKIVILYKKDGELQYKEFWVAGGTTSKKIVFSDENGHMRKIIDNEYEIVAIFIKNPTIPSYAYYQCDGSGKYIWRDLVNDSELEQSSDIYNRVFGNGALYTNININFYLRRQDPNGLYGLQYTSNKVNYKVRNMVIDGLKQTLTDANYKTEENYKICNV